MVALCFYYWYKVSVIPDYRFGLFLIKLHDVVVRIKWFCHFDDDIYVNVKELLKLLSQYDSSKPYYIGRNPRGPLGAGVS